MRDERCFCHEKIATTCRCIRVLLWNAGAIAYVASSRTSSKCTNGRQSTVCKEGQKRDILLRYCNVTVGGCCRSGQLSYTTHMVDTM